MDLRNGSRGLISRLKIMRVDIPKSAAQDGRLRVVRNGNEVASSLTLRTLSGEKIFMRVLAHRKTVRELEEIACRRSSSDEAVRFQGQHGMILVVGPLARQ